MEGNQEKRRRNHVIIVTSDATNANVRQFKIRTWILGLIMIVLFAAFGALLGFLFYEERIWQTAIERSNQQLEKMETLSREKDQVKSQMEKQELALQEQITSLQDEVQLLSTTLNQKVENEKALQEKLDSLSVPTGFPLNGSASAIEAEGKDQVGIRITTSPGVMVIATAKGTVIAVNDDVEYGHNVWVDHGNGYVSIYRNASSPAVKVGDEVYMGTTVFLVGDGANMVGYQMMYQDEYVNPLDVIEIKG